MVIVKHDNPSRLTLYAKLGNTNVTKGQRVKKGQKIGTVAKNNQLYFSLMNVNNKNKRTYINPENVINSYIINEARNYYRLAKLNLILVLCNI